MGHNDRINSDFNVDVLWETGAISTESVNEDWKDVRKEIINKIKLGSSMNEYLQQHDVSYGSKTFQLLTWLHILRLKIPWLVHCILFGGDSFSRIAKSDDIVW